MNIEKLREFCLSLPGVTEDIKWGHDLCFLVGGKMFCVTPVSGEFSASLKVKDNEFDLLCDRGGIIPAPYLARNKWIKINSPESLKPKEWESLIKGSYDLIKSKLSLKFRKTLN